MRPRIPSEKPVVGGILKIHHSESGPFKNRDSMSRHAFTFLKQSRFLKQNPMLGGISPAASCVVSEDHPSVARIFHREKFAEGTPALTFEGGAARTKMSSEVGSDKHWCGRRDSNPHNFRHWNLN